MMQQVSGGTSAEMFGRMFQVAVADPAISAVVLDVDSPGGVIAGIPELWQTIMDARGQKPVVAVANSMAASAAYWVATAADEIVVTPSGEVGSIGVFAAHRDISAGQEKEGVKTTLVSVGKRKVWGNPYEPLSEEARVELQSKVNAGYEMFVTGVAKGRGVRASEVRSGFGEGGMVLAKDAVEAGMADRVGTLAQVLDRLTGARRGPGGAKAEAEEHDLQRLRRATMLN
jgi:signal peptide peptidase SppA